MNMTTPPPELQELLTLVASWREKSSEAGRKAARARQLPDDYETARERVFESCADELELAWARLADAKARTTPNPELPESVVTGELVTRARELFAVELERDGIEFLPSEIRKPNSMLTMFEDRTIRAIVAALTEARAANARAEGWISAKDAKPPEDTPVWCSINGEEPWFGAYCYADGDEDGSGWAWMRCDSQPYRHKGKWHCDDVEWDDQYDVTHWQPLPEPPAAQAVRSEASEGDNRG